MARSTRTHCLIESVRQLPSLPARDDEVIEVGQCPPGVCPLSDNSGQSRILARDRLTANDPKRTSLIAPHMSAFDAVDGSYRRVSAVGMVAVDATRIEGEPQHANG
jgi:hypothetical protein